jgi:DNA topoisomerase I
VIAEKPDAAKKIARALGRSEELRSGGRAYLIRSGFDGREFVVCSARGHMYELFDPEMKRSVFPVFDIEWSGKDQTGYRAKGSFGALQRLREYNQFSHDCSVLVNACDYDIEGETIGSNVLELACGTDRPVLRAKFSALTDGELRQAFSELKPGTQYLASAGRMRHMIDFLWGVNLSRVLTQTAKRGRSRSGIVTIGRVQGPALAFVVSREIEAMIHVPLPHWLIKVKLAKNGDVFEASYVGNPLRTESEAETIHARISEASTARVKSLTTVESRVPPRYPFNLAELQKEAFRILGFAPSLTLAIAEKLYLKSLISYPRTGSQKLPPTIAYDKILNDLGKNIRFSELINSLRTNRRPIPLQGPGDDPAHPAIYPTGLFALNLPPPELEILDLVVRRFLNTFAPDVGLSDFRVVIDAASLEFDADGTKVVVEGWTKFYPYIRFESNPWLSALGEGDELEVSRSFNEAKFDARPSRYNEMSLVAKMEKEIIGTKSTRAEIVQTLIRRGYLRNQKELVPTDDSFNVIEHLEKNCRMIISPEMTRSLEAELQLLESGKRDETSTLLDVFSSLRSALSSLKGMELETSVHSQNETSKRRKSADLGKCPVCTTGTLRMLRSFKTGKRFAGCSNYSKGCKASAPLPSRGSIRPLGKVCSHCAWPLISVWYGRGRIWSTCLNFSCPTKKEKVKRI